MLDKGGPHDNPVEGSKATYQRSRSYRHDVETMQEANLHITKLDKNNDLMNILQKQKEDKFDFGQPVDLYKTPA